MISAKGKKTAVAGPLESLLGGLGLLLLWVPLKDGRRHVLPGPSRAGVTLVASSRVR